MTTTVINIKDTDLTFPRGPYDNEGYAYIGRPYKWGNPFTLRNGVKRGSTIKRYRNWLLGQADLMGQLEEIRGKILVCWCKPDACHGDVLAELCDADS